MTMRGTVAMQAWCRGRVLVADVAPARGFLGRALGWMGRRRPPPGRGLLLRPCGDVHTFFMRFPLDLLFLDANDRVVRVARGVGPWRLVFGGRAARAVVEVGAGDLPAEAIAAGDRITWMAQPGAVPSTGCPTG